MFNKFINFTNLGVHNFICLISKRIFKFIYFEGHFRPNKSKFGWKFNGRAYLTRLNSLEVQFIRLIVQGSNWHKIK